MHRSPASLSQSRLSVCGSSAAGAVDAEDDALVPAADNFDVDVD